MFGIIVGYSLEVNKEGNTLEEVYVMVGTPMGVAQVPISEYILMFAEGVDEVMEVIFDSAEVVKQAQKEIGFTIPNPLEEMKMGVGF